MQARTWICWIVVLICSAASPLLAEPDFRIGVSAPLTGPAAAWGNDVKNVLIFANEKLAGGRYKLIVEDDKCDPKEAVTIAHKFSEGQGLKYVFIVAGTVTLASAPIYGRAGVLVMAPIVTPRAVSKLGDYIFRTTPSDTMAASMLASHISKSHKRVAVLTEGSEYSVGFLDDFSGNARRLGLSVINEHYAPGETDFRASLLKLKAGHPEALFINANTEGSFALILKQARDLDLGGPVFGAYIPGSSTFLKLSGSQAEGIVFTDYPLPRNVMNDSGRALYEEFVSRFGPLQGFEYTFPAVYEAFRAFHEAVNSGKAPKEFLHLHEFDGIFGRFSFDQNGDIHGVKPALKVIRDAQAVLMD